MELKQEAFWKKSYDQGIDDLDPALWESTLNKVYHKTIDEFPQKTALVFMGIEISFASLEEYSNRFAHMLLSNGFKKGDVIGISMPNIPEYVIAAMGTLKAGCVVSGVSPLLSADEMAFQLKNSDAKGFVTLDAVFEKHLIQIHSELPELKMVVAASVGGFLPGIKRFLGKLLGRIPKGKVTPLKGKIVYKFHDIIKSNSFSTARPDMDIAPGDTAYLQYTGGTTGTPKGAVMTHRNALADIAIVSSWLHLIKGKETALSAFPLFHIAGLFTSSIFLSYGITQILIPNPRDTDRICDEMEKYKPFFTANVPSLYHLLMENPKFKQMDHSNLKICITAAAAYPEDSQRKLESFIGKGKLIEAYGMTETSPLTAMNPVKGKKKLGCIGLPLPNTDIKLVDPDTQDQVAQGEPGEICIKGPQVMKGYYKLPDESKNVYDSEGYLYTGDVAVQDADGYLKIVDRTKDMINVSGFKVFSKKIEDILTGHPAIAEIATIGIPDPQKPGSEIVKAYMTIDEGYEFHGGEDVLKAKIIEFAKEKLAVYEVPKEIEFRDELPLTSVGKLDKKELRKEI
ncbi:MAG: long-chain fatty acid--CoA ligase [Deltaproteobacteria bacterium]|nr:long-chain fatty acid--CoA ligase [Deltaproteobacteria bacterium]